MTKNFIRILFVTVCSVLLLFNVSHAQKKATTIHGEIVELTSYVKDGMKPTSPSKKEAVMENLKKGGALAIVDKSNKAYIIVPAANDTAFVQNVSPYLGQKAFVKGQVFGRSGLRLIVLEDIGKSQK